MLPEKEPKPSELDNGTVIRGPWLPQTELETVPEARTSTPEVSLPLSRHFQRASTAIIDYIAYNKFRSKESVIAAYKAVTPPRREGETKVRYTASFVGQFTDVFAPIQDGQPVPAEEDRQQQTLAALKPTTLALHALLTDAGREEVMQNSVEAIRALLVISEAYLKTGQ